jgi:pimeloyl-ACP methyl ester carboxylesterase
MTRTLSVKTRDGRVLRVVDGGDPSGWPIILQHGTPVSGDLYPPQERHALNHGIRLIGYDRPGYGGSDPLPGRRVVNAGADVSDIADHLGLAKFSVWGHSGGGPHALACAATLPDRVASAVASASVAPYGAKGLDWMAGMGEGNLREFGAALSGREALERFVQPEREALLKESGEISPEMLTLLSPQDFELLTGELGRYFQSAQRFAVEKSPEGWIEDDFAFIDDWGFDLSSVKVPTSIWHGKLDRFVPYAHGVWLSEHVPKVEFHSFDQETHLTLYDRHFPEITQWLHDRAKGR